jgi:outer membrane protein OmpA-like peptidoglycan-associated protein
MAGQTYSWEQSIGRTLYTPSSTSAWNLRWWILLAVMTSGAVHVGLFYTLGDLEFGGAVAEVDGTRTEDIRFEERIALDPKLLEQTLSAVPEVTQATETPADLTQELPPIDQLAPMINEDLTVSPETKMTVNINLSTRRQGETGSAVDAISAVDTAIAGGLNTPIRSSITPRDVLKSMKAQDDQMTIKINDKPPNANAVLGDLAAARKRGDEGLKGLGFSSLDDLMDIRTPKTGDLKAMMPSDFLFEYNSAEVRESSKLDLMKLGFLIQTWTKSQVIVEGHTDTIGTEEYNNELSLRRAQAIKDYIVSSLKIDGSRIAARGMGESAPIADPNGTPETQGLNRRVVIRFINP